MPARSATRAVGEQRQARRHASAEARQGRREKTLRGGFESREGIDRIKDDDDPVVRNRVVQCFVEARCPDGCAFERDLRTLADLRD